MLLLSKFREVAGHCRFMVEKAVEVVQGVMALSVGK